MLNRITKSVATAAMAAVAVTSVAAVPAYAVDFDPGATAIVTPTGDWLELLPSESHLYQFNYDFIEDDGDVLSEAIVEVEMGSEDSVSFEIYTPTEIEAWANGEDLESMGVGAPLSNFTNNDDHDTRLIWANRSEGSNTYYVVVENNRSDIASYYEIDITGNGVSFPQAAEDVTAQDTADEEAAAIADVANAEVTGDVTEEAEALVAEAPAADLVEQVAEMTGGYGPEDAVAPMEGEVTLAAGETRWYTFKYDYDDSDSPSQAIAVLEMEMPESVSFEVWTQDTIREWVNGEEYDAIGAGTPIQTLNDDGDTDSDLDTLQWVGSSKASGQYYIVVANDSNQAATFSLTVSGEDVKF